MDLIKKKEIWQIHYVYFFFEQMIMLKMHNSLVYVFGIKSIISWCWFNFLQRFWDAQLLVSESLILKWIQITLV